MSLHAICTYIVIAQYELCETFLVFIIFFTAFLVVRILFYNITFLKKHDIRLQIIIRIKCPGKEKIAMLYIRFRKM